MVTSCVYEEDMESIDQVAVSTASTFYSLHGIKVCDGL